MPACYAKRGFRAVKSGVRLRSEEISNFEDNKMRIYHWYYALLLSAVVFWSSAPGTTRGKELYQGLKLTSVGVDDQLKCTLTTGIGSEAKTIVILDQKIGDPAAEVRFEDKLVKGVNNKLRCQVFNAIGGYAYNFDVWKVWQSPPIPIPFYNFAGLCLVQLSDCAGGNDPVLVFDTTMTIYKE